jgi:colanic acid/amylovoran biosynthesis glycosyltransferase
MAIAYLVSRYPAVSHTFVRREVVALRRRGLAIQTFSLRETPEDQILSPEDEAERRGTWSILPASARELAWAHMTALWRRPGRYFRTL